MKTTIMWFRRDLRLSDHPALQNAAQDSQVVPLFVIDPAIAIPGRRTNRIFDSLSALSNQIDGGLVIRSGNPTKIVAEVAQECGASEVHISAETTPYGRLRDQRVAKRLEQEGIQLVATGSPYVVTPGQVFNKSGQPYQVFSPFFRAWQELGVRHPTKTRPISWQNDVPTEALSSSVAELSEVGELSALDRWEAFLEDNLHGYATKRDRPDLDSTSRLSVALKYGEIHPRTLVADVTTRNSLSLERDINGFLTELAWREFYADVLWHHPGSAWHDLREGMHGMRYDQDHAQIAAWKAGLTGYPLVDAGMRQMQAEGWMHNRVRMVTASFLVKDLHVWWPLGAKFFLDQLLDGDIGSNSHGWQWVAGTGTDAAPYFRIFNPVRQGLRFDPTGDYVRRWIPELAHLDGGSVHEPWRHTDGYIKGYPKPIVDHADERDEALARLEETKSKRE